MNKKLVSHYFAWYVNTHYVVDFSLTQSAEVRIFLPYNPTLTIGTDASLDYLYTIFFCVLRIAPFVIM